MENISSTQLKIRNLNLILRIANTQLVEEKALLQKFG